MSTTYNQQKRPTTNLGRYRQIEETKDSAPKNPMSGEGRYPATDCEELIRLAEKVAGLEDWRMSTATDLKGVLEVIRQAKVLMVLSICGGGLSIVSLVMTIMSLFERNF